MTGIYVRARVQVGCVGSAFLITTLAVYGHGAARARFLHDSTHWLHAHTRTQVVYTYPTFIGLDERGDDLN